MLSVVTRMLLMQFSLYKQPIIITNNITSLDIYNHKESICELGNNMSEWVKYTIDYIHFLFRLIAINLNLNEFHIKLIQFVFYDFIFIYSLIKYFESNTIKRIQKHNPLIYLIVLNHCLLTIKSDNYYYGLLAGTLLLSLREMIQGNYMNSSLLFSILINLNDLFIYLLPTYIIYLSAPFVKLIQSTRSSIPFYKLIFLLMNIYLLTINSTHINNILYLSNDSFAQLFPFQTKSLTSHYLSNFWLIYSYTEHLLQQLAIKLYQLSTNIPYFEKFYTCFFPISNQKPFYSYEDALYLLLTDPHVNTVFDMFSKAMPKSPEEYNYLLEIIKLVQFKWLAQIYPNIVIWSGMLIQIPSLCQLICRRNKQFFINCVCISLFSISLFQYVRFENLMGYLLMIISALYISADSGKCNFIYLGCNLLVACYYLLEVNDINVFLTVTLLQFLFSFGYHFSSANCGTFTLPSRR
ncbi:hypothetical protein K502DRAFT_363394 [Neoconidiobolus thromboides FSU 785]|nr:hypothetical protein K502DRAFT_363394 [Neoconidiobolus thromboides FSU 785]